MKNSTHLLKTSSLAVGGVELAFGNGTRDHSDLWRHLPPCQERPAHVIRGADKKDRPPAVSIQDISNKDHVFVK